MDGDYTGVATSLTFGSADTEQSFTITAVDDAVDDDGESVKLSFGTALPAGVLAGEPAAATVAITDGDVTVSFGQANYAVAEGESVTVTVKLSEAPGRQVEIPLTKQNQGGAVEDDYSGVPESVIFGSADTEQSFTIAAVDDAEDDDGESVELSFGATLPAGVLAGDPASATVAIVDGDVTVSFGQADYAVAEGESVTITVKLSEAPGRQVEIPLTKQNRGGAVEDDYTGVPESVIFGSADTEQSFTITAVDDAVDDDDGESVKLSFGAALPAGVLAGEPAAATVAIDDNDAPPPGVRAPGVAEVKLTVTPTTVSEDAGATELTVTAELTGKGTLLTATEIELAVSDGTASGADYTASGATLTIGVGVASGTATVTLTPVDDRLDEGNETVKVGGTAGNLEVASAPVTITDNDDRGVTVTPTELSVPEGDSMTYEVVLESEPTADVTVTVFVPTDTDVSVTPAALTFTAANWAAQEFTVTADDDDDALADAASVLVHGVSGGDYGANAVPADPVTVKIIEDDVPTLSISDQVGLEDIGAMEFSVTLSTASSEPVTVDYETAGGTATEDVDYTRRAGTLIFPAHSTAARTISVPITNDTLEEPQETFTVTLSDPVAATLDDAEATGTITDNDGASGGSDDPPVLGIEGRRAVESAAVIDFTVTLSPASARRVTVDWETADGTATAGEDYLAARGRLIFAPGDTAETITVEVLNDTLDEDDEETFRIVLSNAENARAPAAALGTIADDDAVPGSTDSPVGGLTIGDARAKENAGSITFTVRLGAASGRTVMVDWETTDGTAQAGADYAAARGRLTFAPGDRAEPIRVAVLDDTLDETDAETFRVVLRNAVHAGLDDSGATGTITDDDAAPAMTIADARAGEGDGEIAFLVTLDAASGRAVSVVCASADGTAKADEDYIAERGVLTFEPGETEKPIRMEVLDDVRDELDETFTLNLSEATHATLAAEVVTATGTITDDDTSVTVPWLARFGRTVTGHVLDAVGERMAGDAGRRSQVTVAGQRLEPAAGSQEREAREVGGFRSMEVRELLSRSSFRLAAAEAEDATAENAEAGPAGADAGAGARWTVWGRGVGTHFDGREDAIALDGDVLTGTLGVDREHRGVLAGLAVAHSGGAGGFAVRRAGDRPAPAREGDLEASLTSVHPYLRVTLNQQVGGLGGARLRAGQDGADRRHDRGG